MKGTMRRPMPTVVVPPGVPPPPLPPSPKCDFYMTQPSSQFTSGHYPSTYNQGLSCTYRIARAKDTCAIELYFYDFDVESSPDCAKDYLELGGKKFCGSELIGQTSKFFNISISKPKLQFNQINKMFLNVICRNGAL